MLDLLDMTQQSGHGSFDASHSHFHCCSLRQCLFFGAWRRSQGPTLSPGAGLLASGGGGSCCSTAGWCAAAGQGGEGTVSGPFAGVLAGLEGACRKPTCLPTCVLHLPWHIAMLATLCLITMPFLIFVYC